MELVTRAYDFHNWQRHTPAPDPAFGSCSPNLLALGEELGKRFGMTNLGCYMWRPIRGGTAPSSHGFGAATDRRYAETGRARVLSEVLPWLIENSAELHLQMIGDYFGSRIWKSTRTGDGWAPATPSTTTGFGQTWAIYLHLETTLAGWADATPIPNRPGISTPTPTPIPTPGGLFVHKHIWRGSINADVYAAQVLLRHRAGQTTIVADGNFGAQTEVAVKNLQAFTGLVVDGIVGPKTWAIFDLLANS